jgi:CheY-like chemotaxis protein
MNKKILIVEDDEFLVSAYEMKLKNRPCEFRTASNGEDALKLVEEFKPDVILLDLVMPKKNGMETLKALKAMEITKKIPVIIASNLGYNDDIAKCISLGAKEYFIKSDINLDDLIDKLMKYV